MTQEELIEKAISEICIDNTSIRTELNNMFLVGWEKGFSDYKKHCIENIKK